MTSNEKSSHYAPSASDATPSIDEYSENGWKFGQGSGYHHLVCDYVPTAPFEVSFEVTDKNNMYSIGVWCATNSLVNFMPNNTSIQIRTSSYNTYNVSVIGKWTIKVHDNKFEVYRNDVYIGERTLSGTPSIELECGTQSGRWIQLKNLKIKQL